MSDTTILLKEAVKGAYTAQDTIAIARDYARDRALIMLLGKYGKEHEQLKSRLNEKLKALGINDTMQPIVSAAIGKLRINLSLSVNSEPSSIASLIIDRCNASVKAMAKQKNRLPLAEADSVCLANELIHTEQQLANDLLKYLK